MLRKLIALLMLLAVLASPASGFDTFWHSEATRKVAEANGFSEDARKIMQLGNFAPDFLGLYRTLPQTAFTERVWTRSISTWQRMCKTAMPLFFSTLTI